MSKTEDSSSADVRQKKGRTFQASLPMDRLLSILFVDFVFPLSSSEPFALGYIDINFSYASPICRLCVFVKEYARVCVRARVKIATSHASTVSTHQQKHKLAPLSDRAC